MLKSFRQKRWQKPQLSRLYKTRGGSTSANTYTWKNTVSPSAIRHLAICLPARDEADSLRTLLPELDGELAKLGVKGFSVFVFDDGSRDGTADVVRSARLSNAEVVLFHSLVRVGKAAGLQCCVSAALEEGAEAIVMMDADGQDNPAGIRDILARLESGLDLVNGRRKNRAHGLGKKISSRAFNAAVRLVSGEQIWDVNSGLKGFSRRGAENLLPYFYGELHRVLVIIAVWLGLSVGEVLVTNRPRFSGRTKYGAARGWRGLFDLVTIQFLRRYHSRPGHFFSGSGLFLAWLGILLFGLGFFSAITGGFFSALLWSGAVLVGFGFVFVSFGFLAELMVFLSKAPATMVPTVARVGTGPSKS